MSCSLLLSQYIVLFGELDICVFYRDSQCYHRPDWWRTEWVAVWHSAARGKMWYQVSRWAKYCEHLATFCLLYSYIHYILLVLFCCSVLLMLSVILIFLDCSIWHIKSFHCFFFDWGACNFDTQDFGAPLIVSHEFKDSVLCCHFNVVDLSFL